MHISLNNLWDPKRAFGYLFPLAFFLLIPAVSVYAAPPVLPTPTVIEVGNQEILRQQEQEQFLRRQQEQTPDVMSLPVSIIPKDLGRLPAKEFPCFKIDRISLVGDAAEKFQWALAAANRTDDGKSDPALGRYLGARGINLVMRRIQNAIIKRGYVTTRVLAAPQDLTTGTFKLTLTPGRVHDIRFATKEAAYYGRQWNAVPTSAGDLLNLRDIEQALENFKRVPTVEADIQITPAQEIATKPAVQPGDSDLVIKWQQKFPLRLSAGVDDSGSKANGKYQGNVTLSYDDLWLLNDLFYVSLNHDLGGGDPGKRGTRGYTAHYSIPFGYWLLGFTSSSNRYHQTVFGLNQSYVYSGESQNNEIKLSRPMYRDAVRKTTLSLRGWERSSKNFTDDTEIEVQRRRMAGWELGINHREFIGASVLDVNLLYRRGTGAMSSLPAPEAAAGEGTSRPEIILADAQLNLPFALGKERFRYTGALKAQWNRTPLVPQDRFAIAGRYTVRGFNGENLLSAERGWLVRNDLSLALGKTGQEFYVGIDHGEIGGPSSVGLSGTCLTGGVLGLRGGYKGLTYDLFVGKPISKPSGFNTSSGVVGFNLNWSI